jgi:hypothetical protein
MNQFTFLSKKPALVPAMHWDGSYQSFQLISDWANGRNNTDKNVRHATRDCDIIEVRTGLSWAEVLPPCYVLCHGPNDFRALSEPVAQALYDFVDVNEAPPEVVAPPPEPLQALIDAAERELYDINLIPTAEDDLPLTLASKLAGLPPLDDDLPSPTLQFATFDEAVAEDRDFKIWGPPPEDLFAFDTAIVALKRGHRVARAGWNGKGMFLFLVAGSRFTVNRPPLLGIYPEGTEIDYHAHIDRAVGRLPERSPRRRLVHLAGGLSRE